MAIQVSYLESSLYPPWFKRSGPPNSYGSMPGAPSHETVTSQGEWINAKHEHVGSFRGNWPLAPTHEEVKSPGLPPGTSESPKTDGWMEIGQLYFSIKVQGNDLGYWSKLDGLGMKVEIAEHRTGDGYNYRWIEPTICTFPNIKLARAATANGCRQSLSWLMHAQYAWTKGMTAIIEAKPLWHYAEGEALFNIAIADVMPVSWTGPNFATDGKLAMETLELAFSQILPPERPEPMLSVPPPYEGRKKPLEREPTPRRDLTALFKAPPPAGTDVFAKADKNR